MNTASPSNKFATFQKLARVPLVITIIALGIGWSFFFYWSVQEKVKSHILTGAWVAAYLKNELQLEIQDCREIQGQVFLKNSEAGDFNLADWVKREKSLGESSVIGTVLKDRKLSWDHVPVASCRLWPQILDQIPNLPKNPEK